MRWKRVDGTFTNPGKKLVAEPKTELGDFKLSVSDAGQGHEPAERNLEVEGDVQQQIDKGEERDGHQKEDQEEQDPNREVEEDVQQKEDKKQQGIIEEGVTQQEVAKKDPEDEDAESSEEGREPQDKYEERKEQHDVSKKPYFELEHSFNSQYWFVYRSGMVNLFFE